MRPYPFPQPAFSKNWKDMIYIQMIDGMCVPRIIIQKKEAELVNPNYISIPFNGTIVFCDRLCENLIVKSITPEKYEGIYLVSKEDKKVKIWYLTYREIFRLLNNNNSTYRRQAYQIIKRINEELDGAKYIDVSKIIENIMPDKKTIKKVLKWGNIKCNQEELFWIIKEIMICEDKKYSKPWNAGRQLLNIALWDYLTQDKMKSFDEVKNKYNINNTLNHG